MPQKQKKPQLFSRDSLCFISTIIKRWLQPFGLHTRSLTIGIVCNFLSSSARFNLCSCFFLAHPCLLLSFLASLGRPFHGSSPLPFRFLTPAVSAFFRPRQFWVLTTQPLFLPFPSLPVSASQWLPQCSSSAFASYVFPVLSCLVSRAFLPGSGT